MLNKFDDKLIDELKEKYFMLYDTNKINYFNELIHIIKYAYKSRSYILKGKDIIHREPNDYIGMVLYIDLFSKDLIKFKDKICYLEEMGINLIHIMPIMKTRDGEDDGGYAISDYNDVNTQLGSWQDFKEVVYLLREKSIDVCIDFVLNHTAQEHTWAQNALNGDKKYQNMYYMFDSYDIPKKFESTITENFPEVAPGNFTFFEQINKWVFTTFYGYQWDLNYNNPEVLNLMIEQLLVLSNVGVNVFRMDAAPHIWKKLGTNCFNLPEVHFVLSIIKLALNMVSQNITLFEEVVADCNIIQQYHHSQNGKRNILYNFPLMVSIWNSLATSDTRYMQQVINKIGIVVNGNGWVNFVRNHDDLAFCIENDVISSIGMDPDLHEKFLIDYYSGKFDESFSRGELYAYNKQTQKARIVGTTASLCGIEKGKEDNGNEEIEDGIKKILLMYGITFSFNGLCMVYSGDEMGTLNDYSYKMCEQKTKDARWLHRTQFNWNGIENLKKDNSIESKIYYGIQRYINVKKSFSIIRKSSKISSIDINNKNVIVYFKHINLEYLIVIANFSNSLQGINLFFVSEITQTERAIDSITNKIYDLKHNIFLEKYSILWLIANTGNQ